MRMRISSLSRAAALVSITCSVYFDLAAILSQTVIRRYDFFSDYISDYAVGPWGWIYGSAFWASCIACVALAISLSRALPSIALSRTGIVLLTLVGVSYAIDAIFPTDILSPGMPPVTVVGMVHMSGALLGWLMFTISSLLLSYRFKNFSYWKRWHVFLIGAAWILIVLLTVLILVTVFRLPVGGLAEKMFIVDRNLWAMLVSVLAFNLSTATTDPGVRKAQSSD